jgi:acetyl-CoA carboxylase carboxyltransferase component
MRRYLHVAQISAVMGSCIAGGAYLPALSDVIFMVEGTSFMGLGGPNLVKGATGQTIDAETLGGARTHTEQSAVAHYRAANDPECLRRIREYIERLPQSDKVQHRVRAARPPARPPADLYEILPQDHRLSYDMRQVLACILDAGELEEFQPDIAREMLCGHAHIEGRPLAVIANQRGVVKGQPGERPRFGGIVYTGSAEKVAYFIETANRERLPILFIQDVSGFMVGPEAEQSGIIRAGARFVEAMATAVVPKIVLTVNHASGAGYYAMAGQGFDPDFILSWPTGRMGVMEGESAVMAVHGAEIERSRREGREPSADVKSSMDSMRADYEAQLDAKYAGARGFVDAIITPEETRDQLAFTLRIAANYPGPHIGPFVLPPLDAATTR